jgi:hypothetical protein
LRHIIKVIFEGGILLFTKRPGEHILAIFPKFYVLILVVTQSIWQLGPNLQTSGRATGVGKAPDRE